MTKQLTNAIICNIMNMNAKKFARRTSELFSVLGNSFRIRLLYAIGEGEASVCHLEEALNKRQPYISQNLAVLRDSGRLTTRRDGKYIFYRLIDLELFDLLKTAGELQGFSPEEIPVIDSPGTKNSCDCPTCDPEDAAEINSTTIKELS